MSDTERDRAPEGAMLIDDFLPTFDATVSRHAVVDAPVGPTYDAAVTADFTRTGPAVRLLNELRTLPTRLSAALGGDEQPRTTDPLRLADLPSRGTWIELDAAPGEEFVFGSIGAVWQPDIDWVEVDAESYRAFGRPGYAKIAASVSVRPYGSGRTLVTYEARTATTDAASRRRFRRYWRVVGPFAGFLMARALDRIAADAEDAAARRETARAPG